METFPKWNPLPAEPYDWWAVKSIPHPPFDTPEYRAWLDEFLRDEKLYGTFAAEGVRSGRLTTSLILYDPYDHPDMDDAAHGAEALRELEFGEFDFDDPNGAELEVADAKPFVKEEPVPKVSLKIVAAGRLLVDATLAGQIREEDCLNLTADLRSGSLDAANNAAKAAYVLEESRKRARARLIKRLRAETPKQRELREERHKMACDRYRQKNRQLLALKQWKRDPA